MCTRQRPSLRTHTLRHSPTHLHPPPPTPTPLSPRLLQDNDRAYLNNHLTFTILYHKDAATDLARIVGFEVEPYSVQHAYEGEGGAPGRTSHAQPALHCQGGDGAAGGQSCSEVCLEGLRAFRQGLHLGHGWQSPMSRGQPMRLLAMDYVRGGWADWALPPPAASDAATLCSSQRCCVHEPTRPCTSPTCAGKWEADGSTSLKTCNAEEKKYVTDKGPHQLVAEKKEVRGSHVQTLSSAGMPEAPSPAFLAPACPAGKAACRR